MGKPLRHGNVRSIDQLLSQTTGVDVYIYAGHGKEPTPRIDTLLKSPVDHLLRYFRGL
jgi:hypothetical protein